MGALEAARSILSAWGAWVPVLAVPLSALAAAAATALGVALACERARSPEEHWTERARRLYPARQVGSAALLFMPLVLGLGAHALLILLSPDHAAGVAALGAVGAMAGATPVTFAIERKARPGLRPAAWLRGLVTMWILVRPVPLVLVFTMLLLPWRFDRRATAVLAMAAALVLALVAGAGFRAARLLGLLWPAGDKLREAVRQAEEAVGHRARAVHECAMTSAFAAALPITNEVVFSTPAVEHLPPDELAAVAAHEVGHLAEPRTVAGRRALGALALLPAVAVIPIVATFGLAVYAAVLVATVVAFVALVRLVRRMERRADAVAHGHDVAPGTYARALERLYQFNGMPAVIGSRAAAHPDLYDRMIAAGLTPAYPRPRRPSSVHGVLGLACLMLPIFGALRAMPELLGPPATHRARSHTPRSRALQLADRGFERESAGDVPGALSHFAAAAEAEPDKVWPALLLETRLIQHGRCVEARAADEMVQRRVERDSSMSAAAAATRESLAQCRPSSGP